MGAGQGCVFIGMLTTPPLLCQTTEQYDTFGTSAAEAMRREAAEARLEHSRGALPDLVPSEMITPVPSSIGVQLLQRMGWRRGKAIGRNKLRRRHEEGMVLRLAI